MKPRLSVRLFATYVGLIALSAVITYVTMRLLAPRLFDQRMGAGQGGMRPGQRGAGPGGVGGPSVRAAFRSALNSSLAIAVAGSVAAAVIVAALTARRIVRPIEAVRHATRRVADGDYTTVVPVPRTPELAALSHDVNSLAATLADTEARRVRLLGDVAHEMRTPLTALDGYVEGLIDGVFTADPETLESLSEELQRLHRLADDLGTLSRTEEQRVELHLGDTDLAEIARRTAQRLAPQFRDAGISLVVDAEEPAPLIADAARIEQVLTNLLGNALAATPSGGRVTVRVRHDDTRALATVVDTGRGLAREDLERIFERFYRAPGARHHAGTGIGLTIARGHARAHGGDLRAGSEGLGTGSCFQLTLPLKPEM